jgi:AcrR family transcriptional regulator
VTEDSRTADVEDRGRRGPGRPRDPTRDSAILGATLQLLQEVGYQRLTIEGVAARAGVGRPTIYRRWPSKPALVVAALVDSAQLALPDSDSGSLRDDLIAVQRRQVELMNGDSNRITAGLVADLAGDSELGETYVREYLAPRRQFVCQILERGVERGELAPGVDFALVYDLLVGPLFMRSVVWGEQLEADAAERTVDAVLAGFAPDGGRRPSSRRPRRS